MIVAKFGGTSVADRSAITRLIAIIRAVRQAAIQPESRDWRGPVVVVSALGGATDWLLGLAAEAGTGDIDGAREHVKALCARHLEVAGVITNDADRAEVEQFIRQEFDNLDRVVGALGVLREVSPRWMDAIAATGEILSSRIVAAALSSHGLAAGWVDARRAIVTTSEHMSAAPLWPETTEALRATVDPVLVQRKIPVLGGFVGATVEGVTTTLGRGGSDYSAAIVGACLDASEIQIWTDVDGMLTADPRIVPGTRVVPLLSFAEASELAVLRRQGPASGDDSAGGRQEHPSADPELAPAAGFERHSGDERAAAWCRAADGGGVQDRRDRGRYRVHAHAHGARFPAPHLRDLREVPHPRGRGDDVGGERVGDD